MKTKIENGWIEQIELGHKRINLPFGLSLHESPDYLDISNKPDIWVFNLFTGYKQFAHFPIDRNHNFRERQHIDLLMQDEKVISVRKRGTKKWIKPFKRE